MEWQHRGCANAGLFFLESFILSVVPRENAGPGISETNQQLSRRSREMHSGKGMLVSAYMKHQTCPWLAATLKPQTEVLDSHPQSPPCLPFLRLKVTAYGCSFIDTRGRVTVQMVTAATA